MDAARESEGGACRAEHVASAHDDDDGFGVNEGDDTLLWFLFFL